jgi:hypothetical protein
VGGADGSMVGREAEFSRWTPRRIKPWSSSTGGASVLRMSFYVTGSCDGLFGGGVMIYDIGLKHIEGGWN